MKVPKEELPHFNIMFNQTQKPQETVKTDKFRAMEQNASKLVFEATSDSKLHKVESKEEP